MAIKSIQAVVGIIIHLGDHEQEVGVRIGIEKSIVMTVGMAMTMGLPVEPVALEETQPEGMRAITEDGQMRDQAQTLEIATCRTRTGNDQGIPDMLCLQFIG